MPDRTDNAKWTPEKAEQRKFDRMTKEWAAKGDKRTPLDKLKDMQRPGATRPDTLRGAADLVRTDAIIEALGKLQPAWRDEPVSPVSKQEPLPPRAPMFKPGVYDSPPTETPPPRQLLQFQIKSLTATTAFVTWGTLLGTAPTGFSATGIELTGLTTTHKIYLKLTISQSTNAITARAIASAASTPADTSTDFYVTLGTFVSGGAGSTNDVYGPIEWFGKNTYRTSTVATGGGFAKILGADGFAAGNDGHWFRQLHAPTGTGIQVRLEESGGLINFYATGKDGCSFSGAVTNITVVNGIVTAAS